MSYEIKYNLKDIYVRSYTEYRNKLFKNNNSKNKLKAVLVGNSITEILADIMAPDSLELKKVRTIMGMVKIGNKCISICYKMNVFL